MEKFRLSCNKNNYINKRIRNRYLKLLATIILIAAISTLIPAVKILLLTKTYEFVGYTVIAFYLLYHVDDFFINYIKAPNYEEEFYESKDYLEIKDQVQNAEKNYNEKEKIYNEKKYKKKNKKKLIENLIKEINLIKNNINDLTTQILPLISNENIKNYKNENDEQLKLKK